MKKLLSLAALAGFASFGHSATYIQTKNWPNFTPTGSPTLTFNRQALGFGETVTSITVSWEVNIVGGTGELDNDSGSAASGQGFQTITVDFNPTGVTLLTAGFTPIGQNVQANASSPVVNLGPDDGDGAGFDVGGDDYAAFDFSDDTTTGSGAVGSAFWGGYTGVGSYTIDVSAIQGTDFSAFGGAAFGATPAQTNGFFRVTINTIPEPSSALLAGVGVMGLLARRRRA